MPTYLLMMPVIFSALKTGIDALGRTSELIAKSPSECQLRLNGRRDSNCRRDKAERERDRRTVGRASARSSQSWALLRRFLVGREVVSIRRAGRFWVERKREASERLVLSTRRQSTTLN